MDIAIQINCAMNDRMLTSIYKCFYFETLRKLKSILNLHTNTGGIVMRIYLFMYERQEWY